MTSRQPPLTPYPLAVLLGRCAREWARDGALFDLAAGRFHRGDPALDLSVDVMGRRAANPAGVAAGPHTQLAQNLVLGWLAGARTFELKTVQILDALEIGRPCIDMETVGYNVEWSQELSLEHSLEEYAKAAMLLEVLGGWAPLRPALGVPGPHLFELSVGYDLAGVTSPRLQAFVRGLVDARDVIDGLRAQLPPPFAAWREHPFATRLAGSATLSTFHGCPPGEVAAIARHLMSSHGLDVTIKLNPTLLGRDAVEAILRDRLGFAEVGLVEEAFAQDLQLPDAVAMIGDLARFARERGRIFGVKLTNTLVVANRKGRLPGERMYLSGPPLHAVAAALLDELVARLPGTLRLDPGGGGEVPVAFSAGVGRGNFAAVAALGVAPVTVCSDLLRPGGYGRLGAMLRALETELRAAGQRRLDDWVAARHAQARAAGRRDAVAAYAGALVTPAGFGPYRRAAVEKPPRRVDTRLEMWDCSSCQLCVSVCPNDAMLALKTPPDLRGELKRERQYVCLAELCNACGNCETFCPEEGAPFAVKPRLFLDRARFDGADGPSFLVAPAPSGSGSSFVVTAAADRADARGRVEALVNGAGGLPLRPEDLK